MSNAAFVPTPSNTAASLGLSSSLHTAHTQSQPLKTSCASQTNRAIHSSSVCHSGAVTLATPRSCSLLWFRVGDLRLSDNEAVAAAVGKTSMLLPIATISRAELTPSVLGALNELYFKLVNIGSTLITRIVDNSARAHVDAVCAFVDVVRPKYILHTLTSPTDLLLFAPLRRRNTSICTFSSHTHCGLSEHNSRLPAECVAHLRDAPTSLPPPPFTARRLVSDLSLTPETMRGDGFARSKLAALLRMRSWTLRDLRNCMQEELRVGCITNDRVTYELHHFRNRKMPVRSHAPIRRTRASSAIKSFFTSLSRTPAVASLGIAAYDVNGGDRRGVEWDEETKTFVLKEWEHTETERRMTPRERAQEFVRRRRQFLKRSFFPEDVTPDYYSFTAWRFAQRCVSATIGVFGTSSLLFALGIRSGRIGQAAVVSWVLKEGLGRVGKMVWAGSMGKDFDVDPKRWRFRSALLYAGGNGLEIVTQIFPASFLLFATAANSMKQVAMLTSSATRNAMYRSFGERSQNIANITAKGEAQIVVADLIGMTCGIRLSRVIGGSRATVLGAYSLLTLVDIFGIYMELRQVVFRSLNPERSSIIINRWMDEGVVLSPSQTSPKERIFLKPGYKNLVRMTSIAKAARNPDELDMLLRVFRREKFMVAVPKTRSDGPCRLVLRRDASNVDVLRAMLLVGHIHKDMKVRGKKEVISLEESERMLRNSRAWLKRYYPWFVTGLTQKGWDTENLLFGTLKRRGYWGQ